MKIIQYNFDIIIIAKKIQLYSNLLKIKMQASINKEQLR